MYFYNEVIYYYVNKPHALIVLQSVNFNKHYLLSMELPKLCVSSLKQQINQNKYHFYHKNRVSPQKEKLQHSYIATRKEMSYVKPQELIVFVFVIVRVCFQSRGRQSTTAMTCSILVLPLIVKLVFFIYSVIL